MDPTPSQSPAEQPQTVTPEAFASLTRQCQRLEKLIIFTVAALILIIFSMNIYFSRLARGYAAQAVNLDYRVKELTEKQPEVRNFIAAMQQYAATDKDFAPIWEKYRPAFSNYLAAANASGTNNPPPRPPAPKK